MNRSHGCGFTARTQNTDQVLNFLRSSPPYMPLVGINASTIVDETSNEKQLLGLICESISASKAAFHSTACGLDIASVKSFGSGSVSALVG
jgi:hypothetical protein